MKFTTFISSRNGNDAGQVEKVIKVKLMTSQNDRSHGSLFLRFGVLAFGLGTLIYVGLEFLSFFEVPRTCMKWAILLGANPVIYMIFVFMQMYYIFVHSRINVNKNKVSWSYLFGWLPKLFLLIGLNRKLRFIYKL